MIASYLLVFTSCSENGDAFIGEYKPGREFISVVKAGDNGYFIVSGNTDLGEEISEYCMFNNGFFESNKEPIICLSNDNLIDKYGVVLHEQDN